MLIDKKAFYKFRYLWLILSGAVSALPLVIPSLGFMQWVSIIPCAIVLYIIADGEKITKKSAYLLGFSFFMSYYAVVFHYNSVIPFFDFVNDTFGKRVATRNFVFGNSNLSANLMRSRNNVNVWDFTN